MTASWLVLAGFVSTGSAAQQSTAIANLPSLSTEPTIKLEISIDGLGSQRAEVTVETPHTEGNRPTSSSPLRIRLPFQGIVREVEPSAPIDVVSTPSGEGSILILSPTAGVAVTIGMDVGLFLEPPLTSPWSPMPAPGLPSRRPLYALDHAPPPFGGPDSNSIIFRSRRYLNAADQNGDLTPSEVDFVFMGNSVLRLERAKLAVGDFRIDYALDGRLARIAPAPQAPAYVASLSALLIEPLLLSLIVVICGGIPVVVSWEPALFPWPKRRRAFAASAWVAGLALTLMVFLVGRGSGDDGSMFALISLLVAGPMAALLERQAVPAPVDHSGEIRIVFIPSEPKNLAPLDIQKELKDIYDEISRSRYGSRFRPIEVKVPSQRDVYRALIAHRPQVVHFSGHGDGGRIFLVRPDGGADPMGSRAITYLFRAMAQDVRLVFLNGCYTDAQAGHIKDYIECTIGMRTAVGDPIAIDFAVTFYMAAVGGRSLQEAFEIAQASIAGDQGPTELGGGSTPPRHILTTTGSSTESHDHIPRMRLRQGDQGPPIYLIKPDPRSDDS